MLLYYISGYYTVFSVFPAYNYLKWIKSILVIYRHIDLIHSYNNSCIGVKNIGVRNARENFRLVHVRNWAIKWNPFPIQQKFLKLFVNYMQ